MLKSKESVVFSAISAFGLMALCFFTGETRKVPAADIALLPACTLAVSYVSPSLLWAIVLVGLSALTVAFMPTWHICILSVLPMLLVTLRFCILARKRYSAVRPLFQNSSIWSGMMVCSNAVGAMMLGNVFSVILASSLLRSIPGYLIAAVLTAVLYVLALVRIVADRSLLTSAANEEQIRTIARGCLRPHEYDPTVDDRKMTSLYHRAVNVMVEKQLFLDDSFDLEEFARKVYSNKSYLSKTINVMSGRNFRQFINYYRIEYAIQLLIKDPGLKMEEVALMSGFHTVVSFNMAFRLFRGETPSDWLRHMNVKD